MSYRLKAMPYFRSGFSRKKETSSDYVGGWRYVTCQENGFLSCPLKSLIMEVKQKKKKKQKKTEKQKIPQEVKQKKKNKNCSITSPSTSSLVTTILSLLKNIYFLYKIFFICKNSMQYKRTLKI
jgi:hypothetical protein